MSYFVKREDPDTKEVTYVEVPDDQLEIPADVLEKKVFEHPKYKEVKTESIERKERIKKLRGELEQLAGEPEAPNGGQQATQKPATAQDAAAPVVPLNEDELFAKFTARLQKQAEEREVAKTTRQRQLEKIAETHGLGAGSLPALEVAADPEALAAILEKGNYRFDDQIGGAPSKQDKDALLGSVLKNLGLDDE